MTKITVATSPLTDVAPLYIAQKQGYFKDEGLDVEVQPANNAAALIPSLLKNELQFFVSTVPNTAQPAVRGLPVRGVMNLSVGQTAKGTAGSGLVVKADSPIRGYQDLRGKTVGVASLQNYPSLALRVALRNAGVDPDDVKYLEVPPPTAVEAVKNGRVDAAYALDPFYTVGLGQGLRDVGSPVSEVFSGAPNVLLIGATQYLDQNPDVVKRFTRAVAKAEEWGNDKANAPTLRALITEYSRAPKSLVAKLVLPRWQPTFDAARIQPILDEMKTEGWVEPSAKVPSAGELFPQPDLG